MKCPFCGLDNTRVIDSIPADDNSSIRPISVEQIEQMVNQIENELFNLEYKEIESKQIGEVVMEHLKTLEQVAYVRFASVYREFKDVGTFMNELKKMLDSGENIQK